MTDNMSADFSRRKFWEGEAPAEPSTLGKGKDPKGWDGCQSHILPSL